MDIANRLNEMKNHIENAYDTLELGGADLTNVNKNIINIDTQLINRYKDYLANGLNVLWNNWDKVIAQGTNLTLNNTIQAKVAIDLKGNTYQDSTTQGKNLWGGFKTDFLRTNNGIDFSNNADGSITADKTTTAAANSMNSTQALENNHYINLPAGTYTLSGNISRCRLVMLDMNGDTVAQTATSDASVTFTTSINQNCFIRLYVANETTLNNVTVYPMLEVGDIAHEYEPFIPNSPSPDYPQEIHNVSGDNTIEICGKNLFDINDVKGHSNSTHNVDNDELTITCSSANANCYAYYNIYNVRPSTTYNFSYNAIADKFAGYFIREYKQDDTYSSLIDLTEGTNISQLITTSANTKYIRIYLYSSKNSSGASIGDKTIYSNIQLEKNNTKTNYQTYQSQIQLISLGVENLFDKDNANIINGYLADAGTLVNNYYDRTLYIPCKQNTTYTISRLASKFFRVAEFTNIPAVNDSWITRIKGDSSPSLTITTTTGNYLAVTYYDGNADTLTEQQILDSIQIEQGSKANSYSEYGKEPIELCKIGDYQDKFIRTSGKNLFDKNNANILNAYIQLSTGKIISSTGDVTIYIKCNPNTQYTISKKIDPTKNRFRFGSSNSTPTIDSYCNNVVGDAISIDNLSSYTYTSSNDAKYLLVQCWVSGGDYTEQQILDSIQIEEGNQATEYNPFGNNEWYLHKEIGKVVLDGSESYTSMGAVDNNYMFYTSSKQIPIDNYSTNYKTNYFTTNTASSGSSTIGSYVYNSTLRMRVSSTIATNGSDFQTWLSTHNTIVYYVLDTPTNTEITDTTLLEQLNNLEQLQSYNNQTNIFQENNDLDFIINAVALKEIADNA